MSPATVSRRSRAKNSATTTVESRRGTEEYLNRSAMVLGESHPMLDSGEQFDNGRENPFMAGYRTQQEG